MPKLGELFIDITTKGIAQVSKDLGATDKNAKKVESAIGKVGQALAALGLVAAVGKMVHDFTSYSEEIAKASTQTGIGTTAIQKLKYAADQSDVSFQSVNTGLKFLARNMYAAATQGGATRDAFSRLGIAVKDSNGQLRPTNEVLMEAADKIKALPNPTERAALAMKLFGKQGVELLPMLMEGSEGLRKMGEEAEQLGIVLDKDSIRAGKEFNDEMKKTGASVKAAGMALAQGLLPILRGVAWVVRAILAGWRELFSKRSQQDAKEQEENMLHYSKMIGIINDQYKKGILTHDQWIAKKKALNDQYRQEDAAIYDTDAAVQAEAGDVENLTEKEAEELAIKQKLAKVYPVLIQQSREMTHQSLIQTMRLENMEKMELLVAKARERNEREGAIELDNMRTQADFIGSRLTPMFESFGNALLEGQNPIKAFFKAFIDGLKALVVQMLATAAVAAILNAVIPGFGTLMGFGQGFGNIFKGMMGLGGKIFQNPADDMMARKEGRDFANLFFGGIREGINSVSGLTGRAAQTQAIVVYADPGIIVKRMARLDKSYKSKFYRDVVRQGQRIQK